MLRLLWLRQVPSAAPAAAGKSKAQQTADGKALPVTAPKHHTELYK
jgi:hypothetical protein